MLEKALEIKQHEKKKPDISMYTNALDHLGEPLFAIGDYIIIEKHYMQPDGILKWLNTKTYRVKKINVDNGDLTLWDDEEQQWSASNYKIGPSKYGAVFKLSTKIKTLDDDEERPQKLRTRKIK